MNLPQADALEDPPCLVSLPPRMVGYFSGRMIDRYERNRQQGDEGARPAGEEERYEWAQKYAELCVESWCAIPDTVRAPNVWRDDSAHYGKWLDRMRAAGVPFCDEGGVIVESGKPPHRRKLRSLGAKRSP